MSAFHFIRTASLLLAVASVLASNAAAQKRPKPLVVELKQKTLLTFPSNQREISTSIRRGGNLLFVPVEINGQKAGYFLVDTGATASLIDTQVANRLKLPVVGTGQAAGIGGKQEAKAVTVEQLSLGEGPAKITLGQHKALSADMEIWRAWFGEEFGGLLGSTVWGQAPLTIDYRARRITFYNRATFAPPPGAKGERLYFHNGHPAVLGILNDKFSGPVVLDTGHEYSLDIDTDFVREHPDLFNRATSLPGSALGIGGKAERWTTTMSSLAIFGQQIENVPVTFGRAADEPAPPNPNVITPMPQAKGLGLMGGRELKNFRLTLDYFYERVYVEYVPDDPLVNAEGKRADPNARDALGLAPLYVAVRNRDVPAAKALLAAGANANVATREGATPLVIAVMIDHGELARMLIAGGARTNVAFVNGSTLLHLAAERGKLATLEALLDSGMGTGPRGKGGMTPLMMAARRGQVAASEMLIAHKADVNLPDDNGQIALHYAVEGGSAAMVAALLKAGADPRHLSRRALDPLTMARQAQKAELVELLERASAKP